MKMSNSSRAMKALEYGLGQAHQQYSDPHPHSRKSYEDACKYLPGGNTRTVLHTASFPLTIASAYGCTLKTVDGQEYIDFFGRIHRWDLWPQQSHNPEGWVLSDLAWTPVCKATKSVAMLHEMLSMQKALFPFLGVFPTLTYVSVISRLSTKLSTTAGITAHRIRWKHSWHKLCASAFRQWRKFALSTLVPKQT